MNILKKIELAIETILFASRWLLAPFFLALAFSLLVLLFKAGQHGLHLLETCFTADESAVVLDVLSLIDICLTGSLVVLVIFSGYENFVCRTDPARHATPAGMDDGDRFRRTENQAAVLHRRDHRDPDLARLMDLRQPARPVAGVERRRPPHLRGVHGAAGAGATASADSAAKTSDH